MFSQRVKELRIDKKLSQEKLAKDLNVSRTTVLKWENGEHETDFRTLVKIADFFDVSLDFLLGRKDY